MKTPLSDIGACTPLTRETRSYTINTFVQNWNFYIAILFSDSRGYVSPAKGGGWETPPSDSCSSYFLWRCWAPAQVSEHVSSAILEQNDVLLILNDISIDLNSELWKKETSPNVHNGVVSCGKNPCFACQATASLVSYLPLMTIFTAVLSVGSSFYFVKYFLYFFFMKVTCGMFFVYLGFSHAMWSYPILPSKVVWTFRMEYRWRKMIRGEE